MPSKPQPAAVTPSAPTPPVRSAGRAPAPDASSPNEVLTARLDAFEQHIRWLESALGELRDRELPELRALAAGRAQVGSPSRSPRCARRGCARRGPAGCCGKRRAQDCAGACGACMASGVAEAPRRCPVARDRRFRRSRSRSCKSRGPSPGQEES